MSAFGDHPWLSAAVVPLAWCWRIERRDGMTLGLTTHDRALVIGGLIYASEPGIRPSAIQQTRAIDGDSIDIVGAITAAGFAEADLNAGRWNGARVTVLVADWQAPEVHHLVIAEARIGAVSSDGAQFSAELSNRDPRLDRAVSPQTSAECRAELGDRLCRVAMAGREMRVAVAALDGEWMMVDAALADRAYAFGHARFLSGAARGIEAIVVAQAGAALLLSPLPEGVVAGDLVRLREGCDRTLATCSGRFGNAANYRGEPHLPGIDLLTRFPGA